MHGWTSVFMDGIAEELIGRPSSQRRIVMQDMGDFSSEAPQIVHVVANRLGREPRGSQILDEGAEADDQSFTRRQVLFPTSSRNGASSPDPGSIPQRQQLIRGFLYSMRRVQCRSCGVVVEEAPWSDGKHHLTKACMLFLARWARKLFLERNGRGISHLLGDGVDEFNMPRGTTTSPWSTRSKQG